MRLLKEKRLPFGVSCCYTRRNIDSISSDDFFDQMVEWGAKFAWYFHYMPVGNDAVPELMPTPEQREYMYHKIREARATKPIFAMDFQNDGEYVDGCVAADGISTSMQTETPIPACSFITPIRISKKKRCLKSCSRRYLWRITTVSRLTTIIFAPVPCLKIPRN